MDQSSVATAARVTPEVLTVLTPWATLAAATGTVVAAVATAVAARFAGSAANAAARAAKAAEDSLEQVRREAELEVAPYLTLAGEYAKDLKNGFARIRNLGRGPAISAVLVRVEFVEDARGERRTQLFITARADISPDETVPQPLGSTIRRPFPPELFADPTSGDSFMSGSCLYCTSITRTAVYRFRRGYPADPPWRAGGDPPYWADALHAFEPDLKPIAPPPLPGPSGPDERQHR